MTLKLYYMWLLLLPYSWIISHYTGITALDKILAPLLLLAALPPLLSAPTARRTQVVQILVLMLIFIVWNNAAFLTDVPLFYSAIWTDAIKIGYFALPLLYVRTLKEFRASGWIVVASAIAGLISVFLVALGWLELPLQRFEITRIGVEDLRKSIGIFPSYGDLAQYVAFTIGFIIVVPGARNPRSKGWKFLRLSFVFIFFIGLIGAQSRNLLMSAVLSIGSLAFLARISQLPARRRQITLVFAFIFALLGLALGMFFIGYIIDLLSSIGGGLAQNTANTRLDQYSYGWHLILENPIWGISAADYAQNPASVNSIHNLWIKLSAKSGIFASLLFLVILWRLFSKQLQMIDSKSRTQESRIVITYFFVMMFSTLFYPAMGELYWALLGVSSSLAYIGEPGTKTKPKSRGLLVEHKGRANA